MSERERFDAACDAADRAEGLAWTAMPPATPFGRIWFWRAFWMPTTRRGGPGHWSITPHLVDAPPGVHEHIRWWPVPIAPPSPPDGAPSL